MTALVVSLAGCCVGDPFNKPKTIDLNVSVDLRALVRTELQKFDNGYLAVGEAGTVVIWGHDPSSRRDRILSDTFTVGESDLNDVEAISEGWLVVGDDGFAALSADEGASWTTLDLGGVTSDLHAIVRHFAGTLIVGDGVVLYGEPGEAWIELAPPSDGWGDLRAGYFGYETYLVGLGGVAWSGGLSTWNAESTGTDADLLAMGGAFSGDVDDRFFVVGTDGTLLRYDGADGWAVFDVGVTADLIDITPEHDSIAVLAADGTVHLLDGDNDAPALIEFERFPGALALFYEWDIDTVVVGSNGLASVLEAQCSGH